MEGGTPVREVLLPYGRQWIDDEDVDAVVSALRSDWLTTGPEVPAFEADFARQCGAEYAVAVCNGTAALHAAMFALDVGPGDEVIVSTMTFVASANCAVYQGATPVFADVDPGALLLDPGAVEALLGPRTRAIVAVDYAGQPCDYKALRRVSRGVPIVADACHALGARYGDRPVGTLGDLSAFSLHPVKHMTTGEGGVITTDSEALARRLRIFRNHGITTDHRQRETSGSWEYNMEELGYNYRLTDVQCALGRSQLAKVPSWVARRREIAARYRAALASIPGVEPLDERADSTHAYHLFVVRLDEAMDRRAVFHALRAEGIGVNVHYLPVHLHPFYLQRFATRDGQCPRAEAAYRSILSLPMFPRMTDADADDVLTSLEKVVRAVA